MSYAERDFFFLFVFAEVVVSLDAPDEFLKTRVMNLPESVVAGTHNTEEGEIVTAKKKKLSARWLYSKVAIFLHSCAHLCGKFVYEVVLIRLRTTVVGTEGTTVETRIKHPNRIGELSNFQLSVLSNPGLL